MEPNITQFTCYFLVPTLFNSLLQTPQSPLFFSTSSPSLYFSRRSRPPWLGPSDPLPQFEDGGGHDPHLLWWRVLDLGHIDLMAKTKKTIIKTRMDIVDL